MSEKITQSERQAIRDLYGVGIESMDIESFESLHKKLRQKYHPDQFEKYNDEVVREMAKTRFQQLSRLGEKIRAHLLSGAHRRAEPDTAQRGVYAADGLKIEILTHDKDLKYRLFGTYLRWLEQGDRFPVPDSGAWLIMEQTHRGLSIGFSEAIKIYLTFGEQDSLDHITEWLYEHIAGRAHALLVDGQRVEVNLAEMKGVMQRKTFLRLAEPGA